MDIYINTSSTSITTTGTNIIQFLYVTSSFLCIKFMISSFSVPMIQSISTYDSYIVSIPTATPESPLTVKPNKDITAPAPTMNTNDHVIYVHIFFDHYLILHHHLHIMHLQQYLHQLHKIFLYE